ncbi:xanthine dehydrogenase family protein subunit M [Microbispora amethystogenes]|uniref:FAD binding domain-containing protein n=1 Tax=Microbispora amethystogenes TaxID=1427754 RepID=UPI003409DF2A
MRPFDYVRPADGAAAVDIAGGRPGAAFLAGGTQLVDLMKLGVEDPGLLVDISRLPYDRIESLPDGTVRIGATARNRDVAVDPGIRRSHPALSQAVLAGASAQIRNVATVGGNLMQRPRCVYFRDISTPCNRREPGSGCSARSGRHRDASILGTTPTCVAAHPSDMAVAMTAFDAVVSVRGRDGRRAVPLTDFYRPPGDDPRQDVAIGPGELITAVELPPLPFASRSVYRKVRDRASFAFALVSVALALDVADGFVRDVRIALGGVAPVPWRARRAEDVLRGGPARHDAFREAVEAELAQADPLPDNAFKVVLIRNLLLCMLTDLARAAS